MKMAEQRFYIVLNVLLLHATVILMDDCNWQFFAHYEQKGCRPVMGTNGCPVRFHCEALSKDDLESCVHNGQVYKAGESIRSLGPCDSCSCEIYRGLAYIECDEVDCPQWEAENKSCYMGYYPNECCPVEICDLTDKTCRHDGKEYKIGELIHTSNPCKICVCTEEWTHEDGPGCYNANCITGLKAVKIRGGCLPIYSEKGCCINEMYCDEIYGASPAVTEKVNRDNYCNYQGSYYERGSTVYLEKDHYQCIKCACMTPPDFTCLKRSCPPRPRGDCKAVPGHCCVQYKCQSNMTF